MEGVIVGPSTYLRDIWKLRYFWFALVKNDLKTRYKRSFLGIGWSLLKPLAMTAIFCLVFGKLFNVPIEEYAPFVLVGMTTWQFITESLLQGSHSLTMGSAYIRQQKIPLAIFPLRTVIGSGFHTGVALIVAIGITIYFSVFMGGGNFHPLGLVYLIPGMIILLLIGWCLAIITGVLGTHFPDTRHLMDVCLQILFYITPILYKPESIPGRAKLLFVLEWNPITSLIALIRTPILEGQPPTLQNILMSLGFLVICAIFAALLLRRLERNLIFWI
jgi:lipopolysaccharide transport system permease protein